MSTDLAVAGDSTLALNDYGDMAGQGLENVTAADVSLPYLTILQSNSPEVAGTVDEVIKDARAGMLFNTVTKELFDGAKGVIFQPCTIDSYYAEWRPDRGGYAGRHPISDPVVAAAWKDQKDNRPNEFGKLKLSNGNDLSETHLMVGLLHGESSRQPVVVSFSSTKIKPYKDVMYRINSYLGEDGKKVPLFAHRLLLASFDDRNKKGPFKNWKIQGVKNNNLKDSIIPYKVGGSINPLLINGRDLYLAYTGGNVKADVAATDTKPPVNDDLPF